MSATFAIPDLHGRADLLAAAIDAIEEAAPGGGTAVFLGDYVDRGPQSRQVIERLMRGPSRPGWRWVCLLGNHEQMMLECLSGRADMAWWLENGGGATLRSYAESDAPARPPASHLAWVAGLPLFHADEHRVYVHAGVDPQASLEEQNAEEVLWMRRPDSEDLGWRALHVVHGHDARRGGPLLLERRTNLDTLAWKTGHLVVGVFDDALPGGPRCLMDVNAAPA